MTVVAMACGQLATALDFDVQSVEEQLLGDDRVSTYNIHLPTGP